MEISWEKRIPTPPAFTVHPSVPPISMSTVKMPLVVLAANRLPQLPSSIKSSAKRVIGSLEAKMWRPRT